MRSFDTIILWILLFFSQSVVHASTNYIVVAANGTGEFTSIQQAIESLPMYCYTRVTLFIKEGVYHEKIRIDRDYITLEGENRENTRIEYSQLREDWNQNPDAIGPAVVNIYADDVILRNLTIENTQPVIGPHAFGIYGTGTRTILKNCTIKSKGGDTVSLWNYKQGMYYHDSCFFSGAVDFVCPRGWCYISNSIFYEHKNTAAVWHAAPVNADQKMVIYNCDFQGIDSFYLARHHYDAQFYFINCRFPDLMRNKPIEHVMDSLQPEKNRPYLYGNRYYFYQCTRKAGNYNWFADNLPQWSNSVKPGDITPQWTFGGLWNPTDTISITPIYCTVEKNRIHLWFNELVMQRNLPEITSLHGEKYYYESGTGSFRLTFKGTCEPQIADSFLMLNLIKGEVGTISAKVKQNKMVTNIYVPVIESKKE